MAVKKQDAVQDAAEKNETVQENAPAEKDTEVVHLFKDSHRYSEPVFVGVNGETYLIQRGVDVEVPKAVAEVLHHSEEMDNAAQEKIAAAEAAAVQQAQRV